MKMKQCSNGHFYDGLKNQTCPYCVSLQTGAEATARSSVTVGIEPLDRTSRGKIGTENTVAIVKKQLGADPVVGWLVCLNGAEKGRDYRLHSDNNFIGRDESMDVVISGDDTVSRRNHARLTFDAATGKYLFSVEEGRSIVRINGSVLMAPVELRAHDKLQIGSTVLMFIPLCDENFKWQ